MKAKLETMFSLPLEKLKADQEVPFPLYIFLKLNDRLIPVRNAGECLGEKTYQQFLRDHHVELWIPSEFQQKYLEFLDKIEGKIKTLEAVAAETKAQDPVVAPQPAPIDPATPPVEATANPVPAQNLAPPVPPAPVKEPLVNPEEVELVKEVLEDPGMSPEEKKEVLSAIGQDILRSINQIADRGDEPRKKGLKRCKQLADEILELAYQHKSIYDEIVALRASQDEMEHSMMVGTISVMFALAIGMSNKEVLADLSLAGLFHDIGLVKVNPSILGKPEKDWTGAERHEYEGHIVGGINLLKESSKDFSPHIFRMIQEHHENYDGSGFPEQRQGGSIAETSQILHLANLFDRLCTGRIDGNILSPQDAFERIGAIATNPQAVQEVNPSLVRNIFQFILKDAAQVMKLQKEMTDRSSKTAAEVFNPN